MTADERPIEELIGWTHARGWAPGRDWAWQDRKGTQHRRAEINDLADFIEGLGFPVLRFDATGGDVVRHMLAIYGWDGDAPSWWPKAERSRTFVDRRDALCAAVRAVHAEEDER